MRRSAVLLAVGLLAGCSVLPEPFRADGAIPGVGDPAADGGALADGAEAFATDLYAATDLPAAGCVRPTFDWRDAVMYFVMVDRFADGDPKNNAPVGAQPALDFQGGDLAGVLQKLEQGYFTDLGVNVLWLSGPFGTPSKAYVDKDGNSHVGYHGYWPAGLTEVDAHLGSMATLQQVVSEAHGRGIRVVLDYVMNHVHEQSAVYNGHKEWFWPLTYNGKKCVCGKACSYDHPVEGRRCWFEEFLPDFDFTNAAARKFSVENALWWIKSACLDGLRLDAVKHIEMSWLTDLRARVNQELGGARFYLVGETYSGDRDLLKQYIDPKTRLDGQFDFPLRAQLVKVILRRGGSFKDLDTFLAGNETFYDPGTLMGTFISNHDVPRAVHHAEDAPRFKNGEWESGRPCEYSQKLGEPDSDAPYQRLAVGYTALLTLPGVPLIYYGAELGMAGCGDPDNRRFMVWDKSKIAGRQETLRGHIGKLTAIRGQHPALTRGKRETLTVTDDLYLYSMTAAGDQLLVVLNRSDSAQTFTLPGASYTDLLTGQALSAPFKVPARGSLVLK
jgi:glycosidase